MDAGSSCAWTDAEAPTGVPDHEPGAPPKPPTRPLVGAEAEVHELPAGVAGPAPKARILDTLENSLQAGAATQENAGFHPAPGAQRALDLEGVPAQLGFDGLPYTVPTEVHDPDDRPDLVLDVNTLAFDFSGGEVQMGLHEWHHARDDALVWLSGKVPRGKNRKRLRAAAKRGRECGRFVRAHVYDCDHPDRRPTVASHCKSRTCPASARADSIELRAKVEGAFEVYPLSRRGRSAFLHTITVWKPDWATLERLKVDADRVKRGWTTAWKFLKRFAGAKAAQTHIEVGPHGNVHLHALAWHYYVHGQKFAELRDAVTMAVDPTGRSPQYKVQRVKRGFDIKGAIAEVCKYATKGVATTHSTSKQTHPMLAAMVELAFQGRQLARQWGDWSRVEPVESDETQARCPTCGAPHVRWLYTDTKTGETATAYEVEEYMRGPPRKERPPP